MTLRVAIYARVSVDDRAVSLDAQEAGARQWAARHGHAVVAVHRDDGVSGAEWDRRPGVQAVRAEALSRPRPWDVLVVRDLDRLGRDGVRLPLLLVDLRDAGASVVEWTTGQTVAVDGMALVLAQLRATMAAEERRAIASRTRVALEARARQGLVVGGEVFGYRRERRADGVHYLPHDEQAATVRAIFAARAEGATIRAIVADLNSRGVPSPSAGRRGTGTWCPSAVHEILSRDRYLGVLRWGAAGEEYRHGTVVRVARADAVTVERPELAIVDRDTWERVRALDAPPRQTQGHGKARAARHLLVGRSVCDACGGRTAVTRTRVGRESVPAYVCGWRHDRKACESRWLRPVAALDEAVLAWVGAEVVSDAVLADVLAGWRREREEAARPEHGARAAELRAEERSLAAAVQRLALAVETAPDVGAVVVRLRAQQERLRQVRGELASALAPTPAEAGADDRLARIVTGLRERLRVDVACARDVLALVLDGPMRVVWQGAGRGVRLRGVAVPERLLDLGEAWESAKGVQGEAPAVTRGPGVSPAGPGRSPRLVVLDLAA